MCAWEKYYEEKLYPLQNGVLNIVSSAKTPFFLTGGTALSRYYTCHRYSDDLDFFVVRHTGYHKFVDTILEGLIAGEGKGFFRIEHDSLSRSEAHTQLYISACEADEIILKIEFVNDVAQHYGELITDPLLGRVDSIRNILSNKLTALFRSEPKDVADIYAIALEREIDWREIVTEAKTKEAGADPDVLHDILRSFPLEQLNRIKWIDRPDFEVFGNGLKRIAEDILYGRKSLLSAG